MIRVRILESRPRIGARGQEFNYPNSYALNLIKVGLAERIEDPEKTGESKESKGGNETPKKPKGDKRK